MSELVYLSMKPIMFYSRLDEASLMQNLQSLSYVKDISYVDEGMRLLVEKSECGWEEFKDILSLYIRYNIDLKCLHDLVPDEDVRAWFVSAERDWHSQL